MNWVNIHTETLRGEEYVGAEPSERATWLSLLGWCCAQENDGVIQDCKSWGSRKWQQLCGVTKEEVELASELYFFDGENLVVNFYPIEQQASVKAKRIAGRKGGRPKKTAPENPILHEEEKPHGLADGNHMGNHERNVKERKGKESNSKEKEIHVDTPAIAWSSTDGWSGITDKDRNEWNAAYPACNIDKQLASMNQWLLSNPAKSRKKLWRKFLTNWLSRQQERGGDIPTNKTTTNGKTFGQIEQDRKAYNAKANLKNPLY